MNQVNSTMSHLAIGLALLGIATATDITAQVFGTNVKGMPAAFGDFNSDELTDLFVIRDKTVEVLLSTTEGEPVLRSKDISCTFPCHPTSVVPGDFNGDAFMDVLVTTECLHEPVEDGRERMTHVIILWGHMNNINCTNKTMIETRGQPLALDYNNDFITDLYGEEKGERYVWQFNKYNKFDKIKIGSECGQPPRHMPPIRNPHSNAYLDFNNDCIADLFVTSGKQDNYWFELWEGTGEADRRFQCNSNSIFLAPMLPITKMGQSLFLDVEVSGRMDHILPVTTDKGSKLFIHSNTTNEWHDLNVTLIDPSGKTWEWGWDEKNHFLQAITIRGGDFNMDGYPDLLATVMNGGTFTTVLLENVPCSECLNVTRKFQVQWDAFLPIGNDTIAAVFYDIFQDGVVDVLLIYKRGDEITMGAFKNNLDYDANFVKVMVLSGLQNPDFPTVDTPLGKKKRTFGSNLPGPRIWYKTVDQEGNARSGMSAQIPQSAHFALSLPYTTFSLGRTPNFVESLSVCFAGKSREWSALIPNSQIVVIPSPVDNPSKWKVQLFVTPSKAIILTAVALIGTCLVISITICILHYKEKRNDRLERLQESFRFLY